VDIEFKLIEDCIYGKLKYEDDNREKMRKGSVKSR